MAAFETRSAQDTGSDPDAGGKVEQAAEDVHDSTAVDALARLGLASRGLVWFVVGVLAVQVLRGRSARADKAGALRALADKPFGEVLLVVLVVGFCGYALWQVLCAAVGHRQEQGRDRTTRRAKSAGKALIYLSLAGSVVRFLAGAGAGSDPTSSLTGRLMQQPGGRWLVGVVGVGVVGAGVALAARALKGTHAKKIETLAGSARWSRAAVRLGTVGLLGRAGVLALVGAFLVGAAVQADPRKAKGLDAALHALAREPAGAMLLGLAVVGLLSYAAWSFAEAALHRHSSEAS